MMAIAMHVCPGCSSVLLTAFKRSEVGYPNKNEVQRDDVFPRKQNNYSEFGCHDVKFNKTSQPAFKLTHFMSEIQRT